MLAHLFFHSILLLFLLRVSKEDLAAGVLNAFTSYTSIAAAILGFAFLEEIELSIIFSP